MATATNETDSSTSATELSETLMKIAEQSQRIVSDFVARQDMETNKNPDPLNIGNAFMEMTARIMADPARLAEAQANLWNSYIELWQ